LLSRISRTQGNDTIIGGSASDVLIGDYGRIQWADESNIIVATAGLGGYGDATDDLERSIFSIEVVYPSAERNNYDSGIDVLYGNGERDVLIGGSGLGGEFSFRRGRLISIQFLLISIHLSQTSSMETMVLILSLLIS
jgi:Ca2+-binding RTX toxin-like protein